MTPTCRYLPASEDHRGRCGRADACVVPSKLLSVSANSGDGRPNPVYNYPAVATKPSKPDGLSDCSLIQANRVKCKSIVRARQLR